MNRPPCPKSGIKIHETQTQQQPHPQMQQHSRLSKPISFQNTTLNTLDLDLDHYSLEDLYNLFNISFLNEDTLKIAKQITLKMHPDKSHLDSKYFLFFSKAYKRLYGVYEFQNKSTNKKMNDEDFFDDSNRNILNNMFEKNKEFKDSRNFNTWFNDAFEKHRVENPLERGYGDWLKSNDDFIDINENVTKSNMNEIIEQKKKQVQAVTVYTGVTDLFSSTFGASMLDGSDGGSGNYFTDLKEAYTQTLIPVTNEDYNKIQKFNTVSEYKAHRERVDVTPLSKSEAERKLYQQQLEHDKNSAALAYKYAKESEKVKEKQNSFWSDLKLLNF